MDLHLPSPYSLALTDNTQFAEGLSEIFGTQTHLPYHCRHCGLKQMVTQGVSDVHAITKSEAWSAGLRVSAESC